MAIVGYAEIIFAILFFLFLSLKSRSKSQPLTEWPLLGMLPALLHNAHRMHDYATEVLNRSGLTVAIKGPMLGNMDMIVTSDPANAHYISSKNFHNFPKGSQYKKIFDVLGDGIFNTDSDMWREQRKLMHSLIKHGRFQQFLEKTTWRMVENGLIPVLDHVSKRGLEVDMQDLFQRLTFDSICVLVLGFDPRCLSIDFAGVQFAKAFDEMEEVIFRRYIVPQGYWKLQRWLCVGVEKKMARSYETVERFITQCIKSKQEELKRCRAHVSKAKSEGEGEAGEVDGFNLLTAYIEKQEEISEKFLRDTAFNLMAAGRDTVGAALTWFMWLVATHPRAEAKILEEVTANLPMKSNSGSWRCPTAEELSKLVYLHGALCETLRLYPPVPVVQKAAARSDTLPSGHSVEPNATVCMMLYSMGRAEEIWGKDCLEFKPERWILESGGIRHAPSYKFIAFNAGPRSCLGKEMSFVQMKAIAMAIIYNYRVELVEGHDVSPSTSVILHMKHGLKVRVFKRSV